MKDLSLCPAGRAVGSRNGLESLFEDLICMWSEEVTQRANQSLGKPTGSQKLLLEQEVLSNQRPSWKGMRYSGGARLPLLNVFTSRLGG